MKQDPADVAEKCGRFIRFALLPRLLPADEPEYLELVREFLEFHSLQTDIQDILVIDTQFLVHHKINLTIDDQHHNDKYNG